MIRSVVFYFRVEVEGIEKRRRSMYDEDFIQLEVLGKGISKGVSSGRV